MNGRDINDTAPVTKSHGRQGESSDMKGCREVHGEYIIPLMSRELFDRSNELDSCIVNEDIDGTELGRAEFNEFLDLIGATQIGGVISDARSQKAQIMESFFMGSKTVEQDISTLAGEFGSDSEADPASRPSYQSNFPSHPPSPLLTFPAPHPGAVPASPSLC